MPETQVCPKRAETTDLDFLDSGVETATTNELERRQTVALLTSAESGEKEDKDEGRRQAARGHKLTRGKPLSLCRPTWRRWPRMPPHANKVRR